ncbi:MAG: hypothetical protein JNM68_03945, partial [Dinghuibacter sp.]|nr:hypothetical protein [Dinghuibacter sp.]
PLWLQQCKQAGRIAPPALIPQLLHIGAQNKAWRPAISSCCGKRGEWLALFNEAWNFSAPVTGNDTWQTGSADNRKSFLHETRQNNPEQAIALLQQTWATEDAATKTMFLQILTEKVSQTDIPFLEQCLTEKSKKVKEEAIALLKRIPESVQVQRYCSVLQKAVVLKKEKTMLGLSSKMVLHLELPADIDEEVFRSGIEKLSSDKEFTDEEFILYQLVEHVPPAFWETQLEADAETVIRYFQKEAPAKKMLPAMALAAVRFNDARWAKALAEHSEVFYLAILPLLPKADRERFSIKFFNRFPDEITEIALQEKTEWGVTLAEHILRHMAANGYRYNRPFLGSCIGLLPTSVVHLLPQLAPADNYMLSIWNNTIVYLEKLLDIKKRIALSFNE